MSKVAEEIKKRSIKEIKKDVMDCSSLSCYNFSVFTNKRVPGYYVRYSKIDTGGDSPRAKLRWICLNTEGVRTDCDPIFKSVPDENKFYADMVEIAHFEKLKDLK
jgi:hypothetical protein